MSEELTKLFSSGYWRQVWQDLQLAWQILRDRRTPIYLKAMPVAVVIYILTPVDLIPDFLPVLGQIDDVALALLALNWFLRLTPPELVAEHREKLDLAAKLEE